MINHSPAFVMKFAVGGAIVLFERNRLREIQICLLDIAGVCLNGQSFPAHRQRPVLTPLNVDSWMFLMPVRIFHRFRRPEQAAVKVGGEFDDLLRCPIVSNPNELVIARVVVFWEINVIFTRRSDKRSAARSDE